MGGQACVFYGAAEFSRDTDFAILADAENLARLGKALAELQAEPIALPPFELKYLVPRCFRWSRIGCWWCCDSAAQSQGDCSYQPWVARNELPRVSIERTHKPERGMALT
jgi:hypothetical protein